MCGPTLSASLRAFSCFFFYRSGDHRDLHSFPTRRSSDLLPLEVDSLMLLSENTNFDFGSKPKSKLVFSDRDRKSTRLNSSHTVISYAVFCLKKKKKV